jgi:hypothetical protein
MKTANGYHFVVFRANTRIDSFWVIAENAGRAIIWANMNIGAEDTAEIYKVRRDWYDQDQPRNVADYIFHC